MSAIEMIRNKARADIKRIVLPEGDEVRTVEAASILKREGMAEPILLGDPAVIRETADRIGVDFGGICIENPAASEKSAGYAKLLYELRKAKGLTEEEAQKLVSDVMY